MWFLLVWTIINAQPSPHSALLMTSQADCEAASRMINSRAVELTAPVRSECFYSRVLAPDT